MLGLEWLVVAKPIFKFLLPHSAQLYHYSDIVQNGDGEDVLGEPTELTFVRFEPSSKVIIAANGHEAQLNALMFFDITNSGPKQVKFHLEDHIVFNQYHYIVKEVSDLWDAQRLHHYEIGLV